MSLSLNDVQSFLETADLGCPVQLNWLPDKPDTIVVANTVGGTEPILDGAFEAQHVLIRIRSSSDADCETIAKAVHAFLSSAEGSFQMGSTYVMTLLPQGGVPTFAGRDDAERSLYQGTYQFTVAV